VSAPRAPPRRAYRLRAGLAIEIAPPQRSHQHQRQDDAISHSPLSSGWRRSRPWRSRSRLAQHDEDDQAVAPRRK